MKTSTILGLATAGLFAAGCALSPERADALREMARQLHDSGALSQAQYDGMVDTIRQASEGVDWNAIATGGISVLLSILGIPPLINRMRGPVGKSRAQLERDIAALKKLESAIEQLGEKIARIEEGR